MTQPEKRVEDTRNLLSRRLVEGPDSVTTHELLEQVLRNQLTLLRTANVQLSWDRYEY